MVRYFLPAVIVAISLAGCKTKNDSSKLNDFQGSGASGCTFIQVKNRIEIGDKGFSPFNRAIPSQNKGQFAFISKNASLGNQISLKSFTEEQKGNPILYMEYRFSCTEFHSCQGFRTNANETTGSVHPIVPTPGGASVYGYILKRPVFRYETLGKSKFSFWAINEMAKDGALIEGTKITCDN